MHLSININKSIHISPSSIGKVFRGYILEHSQCSPQGDGTVTLFYYNAFLEKKKMKNLKGNKNPPLPMQFLGILRHLRAHQYESILNDTQRDSSSSEGWPGAQHPRRGHWSWTAACNPGALGQDTEPGFGRRKTALPLPLGNLGQGSVTLHTPGP